MDATDVKFEHNLEEALLHLSQVMRHVLANIVEESHALAIGNGQHIRFVLSKRDLLLQELSMKQKILADLLIPLDLDWSPSLENLDLIVNVENISILSLRDQILTLADHIEDQNRYNRGPIAQRAAAFSTKKQGVALLDPLTEQDL